MEGLGRVVMAAHPRVGGENLTAATPPPLNNGSSPRRRGKRDLLQGQVELVRLIPA